jgi:hypothetical protein
MNADKIKSTRLSAVICVYLRSQKNVLRVLAVHFGNKKAAFVAEGGLGGRYSKSATSIDSEHTSDGVS